MRRFQSRRRATRRADDDVPWSRTRIGEHNRQQEGAYLGSPNNAGVGAIGRIVHYAGDFIFMNKSSDGFEGQPVVSEVGNGRRLQKFLIGNGSSVRVNFSMEWRHMRHQRKSAQCNECLTKWCYRPSTSGQRLGIVPPPFEAATQGQIVKRALSPFG